MANAVGNQIESIRGLLVEAARLLALEYKDQVAALPSFVHVPDELLIEFDEAFRLAPQALEVGALTSEQFALAAELDGACGAIHVSDDYPEALAAVEHAPEWKALRQKARELLAVLGEECRLPDFRHTVYVRSSK